MRDDLEALAEVARAASEAGPGFSDAIRATLDRTLDERDTAYIVAASPDVVLALIERVRAAEAERDAHAVTLSACPQAIEGHSCCDCPTPAEAAVARVEALMRMLEEEAAPYILGGSRHEAASDAITALADVRAETAQRLRSALHLPARAVV